MRDLKNIKQIRHCNIIPSDLLKLVFLEQTEMVFSEMKTISQWKRRSERNGIAPTGHKCTENPKTRNLFKVSATPAPDLDQNQKRVFINALIPCSGTQGTPERPNTFNNCFTQIDHKSTH